MSAAAAAASAEPPKVPAPKGGVDDRAALLNRGRRNRTVHRADEHLNPAATTGLDEVPEPYDARGAGGLDDDEAADLAACERAVAGLQQAFTVAGKALSVINQARLYRGTHGTFVAYVEERWGMKKSHAYRLMEAWPVAVALSPRGDIPEKHVRAFLPLVRRHGLPAARAAYEALHEQNERVTTSRITEAVRVLPARLASPEQAGDVVRVAAVEGRLRPASVPAQDDGRGDVDHQEQHEPGPGDLVNRELRACVDDLTRVWNRVQRINASEVPATDHGAAVQDASTARALSRRIIKGLTVPGAPGGGDE